MKEVADFIKHWLIEYLENSNQQGFVVGISGGVDSALCGSLCALTGKSVLLVNLPLRQNIEQYQRASLQIRHLESHFKNVKSTEIDLSHVFSTIENTLPNEVSSHSLAMANTRSRLRMLTLYALAQSSGFLVVGTGNKVEDFGIGFFTKYGDGGVDLSPIADLTKSQVFKMAGFLEVIPEILMAKPTDGLWGDERTDEDQIGATYPELEWAMEFSGDELKLNLREKKVLEIYRKFNTINRHKMVSIPVCQVPESMKTNIDV